MLPLVDGTLGAFPFLHGVGLCQCTHGLFHHADQQWARSATALQQALTTLATDRPTKRLRQRTPLAPDERSPSAQQADGHPPSAPATESATPADIAHQAGRTASLDASGSAPHRGAASRAHATAAVGVEHAASQSSQLGISLDSDGVGRSEQGPAEQALHFAHGLLGNPSPVPAVHSCATVGDLPTFNLDSAQPSSF